LGYPLAKLRRLPLCRPRGFNGNSELLALNALDVKGAHLSSFAMPLGASQNLLIPTFEKATAGFARMHTLATTVRRARIRNVVFTAMSTDLHANKLRSVASLQRESHAVRTCAQAPIRPLSLHCGNFRSARSPVKSQSVERFSKSNSCIRRYPFSL